MDWLIGLLLLITGGIIGYFVAKYFKQENSSLTESVKNEQTIKEMMSQQATEHLHESKKIATLLSQQADALAQQISQYEQVIISQNSGGTENNLNYFGEHTTAYLSNKAAQPSREKNSANVQPLDFSAEGSGLFSGSADANVKEVK